MMAAKPIVASLKSYLLESFPIDKNMIDILQAKNFIAKGDASEMGSLVKEGKKEDALTKFLTYIEDYYTVKRLSELCDQLDKMSEGTKPMLEKIASRIRKEMKKFDENDE